MLFYLIIFYIYIALSLRFKFCTSLQQTRHYLYKYSIRVYASCWRRTNHSTYICRRLDVEQRSKNMKTSKELNVLVGIHDKKNECYKKDYNVINAKELF